MAKNCFLLILFLNTFASIAQVKIGVIGGPQSASVIEKNDIANWDTTTGKFYTNKRGIHIGVMAEIPLSSDSRFYFEPALLYSQKGRNYIKSYQTNVGDSNYSYYTTQNLDVQYIDIPLNILYKLPLSTKKNVSYIISAGPYISLFYNGKRSFLQRDVFTSPDTSINTNKNNSEKLQVGKKDDSYKLFGYGVNARTGLEIGKVTLTAFISQGLENFYYADYNSTFKHRVYGASLGIWIGTVKEPLVIKDKDKDGVTDDKDACPLLPGTAITNGCPDKDGDGIADKTDKCIDIAGTLKYNGCPITDTDSDGVNDEEDKCADIVGTIKYNGCPVPDTDTDNVNDEEDKCPNQSGTAKYNGCPVPDTDTDGVNDELDKCPDVAGDTLNSGCPLIKEEIIKQVEFAAENIFFEPNSVKLLQKSNTSLNAVVDILNKYPQLTLFVNGYTDNIGTIAINQTISQKRAQAVKAYLVKNGIADNRITAKGYGPANPIANNKTAVGRTKNRRVELKLNNQ